MDQDPFLKQEQVPIRVELAQPKDFEVFKQIVTEAFNSPESEMFGITEENRESRIAKITPDELSDPERFVTLSWAGSDVVGVMRALKESNEIWHLRTGYVRGSVRNIGIGKKLYQLNLDEIRKRGGKKVTIGVKTKNTGSIKLAKLFGFKNLEGEDPEKQSMIGMEMELDLKDKK